MVELVGEGGEAVEGELQEAEVFAEVADRGGYRGDVVGRKVEYANVTCVTDETVDLATKSVVGD